MTKIRPTLAFATKMFRVGQPLALIWFVTKRCNAKCRHCFYWASLNSHQPNELNLDEIDQIARKLGRLAYLRLSGGEPFLRLDLFDLVSCFVRYGNPLYVGIPTNGYYTDRVVKFAQRVRELPCRVEIGISIDGLAEHHDFIRGSKNGFKKGIETFQALKALKKSVPNLGCGFITTVIKSNQMQLMELFDYLRGLEPDGISCNIVRDDSKVAEEKEIDLDLAYRFSALCDQYCQGRLQSGPDLFSRLRLAKTNLAHILREKTIRENTWQIPCVAGDKIVVMYAEGEVFPCETLDTPLGNIRDWDYNLHALLTSATANAQREKIVGDQCFCTHECFTSASITFKPRQLARISVAALKEGLIGS